MSLKIYSWLYTVESESSYLEVFGIEKFKNPLHNVVM